MGSSCVAMDTGGGGGVIIPCCLSPPALHVPPACVVSGHVPAQTAASRSHGAAEDSSASE